MGKEHKLACLLTDRKVWLVTGATGFIGSHLVEFLLAHHQTVVCLDNFATGHQSNIDQVLKLHPAEKCTLISGDIRNIDVCRQAVQGVDFVLHQAALGSVPRSIHDPMTTHDVNVTGFLNMLIAAKDAKVKRFVYASSSSVYGDSKELPKVETHQGNPLSPYAVSKMSNELYAKAFSNCYDLETIGLRYFNVFGPRQDPNGPYAAVIPLWARALLNNEPVYVNGDGSTSRDFCYVENVVQANILSALTENQAALNTVYNIAVGEQITLIQLYELLRDLSGNRSHKLSYRDFRAGDVQHSLADISKARQLLNYTPTHDVRQGLALTMDWYRNHVEKLS